MQSLKRLTVCRDAKLLLIAILHLLKGLWRDRKYDVGTGLKNTVLHLGQVLPIHKTIKTKWQARPEYRVACIKCKKQESFACRV